MYDKMVRFIKQTGKAHKWLKPLALILLFCSAALARLAANWPVQKTTSIPRGGKYKGIYHLARGSSKHQTKRRNRPNPSALRPSRRPAARAAAAALSVCMVFTLMPSMAFAVEAEPLPPEDATVTAFDELDEAVRYPSVTTGTPLEELVLPDTLSATAQAGDEEPKPVKISGVVWEPDELYAGTEGVYAFTASAQGYVCAAGVDWPVITVTVEKAEPDEVDALCAAIDALPTVEELYESAPGDADPEFDDWVTETKARLAEVSALWEQFLTLSEDGAAIERITEARAEKLAALYNLAEKLPEAEPQDNDEPVPTVSGNALYANGAPLLLTEGTDKTDGKVRTVVYVDKGTLGQLDSEDVIFDPDGSGATYDGTTAGNDLSTYFIFGGGKSAVTGGTKLTMTGGKIYMVTGGSSSDGTVSGGVSITISGGTVEKDIRGGGSSSDVSGGVSIIISGGEVKKNVFGGGINGKVDGNISVTISGNAIIGTDRQASGVSGGGMTNGVGVTGDTSVAISGGTVINNVYGGGTNGSVTGTASVAVTGGEVKGSVYGGSASDSVAVNGAKTVTVGAGAKIGGDGKGIVLNGGTGSVSNGVDSFIITPDLTGADGCVYVNLPAGYDVSSNPTIATGAVQGDLAKLKLMGNGAADKEAYFENNEIKVRAKAPAHTHAMSVDCSTTEGTQVTFD